MYLVVGLDAHARRTVRDPHAAEAAGERLLVLVRMEQRAGAEHAAVLRDHPPGVRVVLPAGVAVAQRDADLPGAVAASLERRADDLDVTYRAMEEAYVRIFTRCGLSFTKVEADTGNIGGSASHEFMVTADTGEDAVLSCVSCGYGANVEKAESGELAPAPDWTRDEREPTEVATPGASTIDAVAEMLGVAPAHLIVGLPRQWAVAFDGDGAILALKPTITAGFVRDDVFFTREEAASAD